MNKELRQGVQRVSQSALDIVQEYFDGKRPGTAQIKEAMKMIGFGLKVEHIDQLAVQNDRSIALRLIKFLPNEVDKDQYILMTNPQIQPLLLKKPEKTEK